NGARGRSRSGFANEHTIPLNLGIKCPPGHPHLAVQTARIERTLRNSNSCRNIHLHGFPGVRSRKFHRVCKRMASLRKQLPTIIRRYDDADTREWSGGEGYYHAWHWIISTEQLILRRFVARSGSYTKQIGCWHEKMHSVGRAAAYSVAFAS